MQRLKKTFLGLLFSLIFFTACERKLTTANYQVIPLPQAIEQKHGEAFPLEKTTQIVYPQGNEDLKRTANFLANYLEFSTGMKLSVSDAKLTEKAIILSADLEHENKEAYKLDVELNRITINGASAAGAFYGVQTLRKSIAANSKGNIIMMPQVSILDYPRFPYRAMMLDVGRHMFPLEFIKEYIDILALHNINNFHWHLTDDQGWRIEIKKYPKLTEIAAYRNETVIGRNTGEFDGKRYGGFYTQEEAKGIVAYAAARHINVIPEIDLPGHMQAALSAYPEYGCTGGPYEAATQWGVFEEVLCAGNDETIKFLEGVFEELIEIFPSNYIHVGGDECPKDRWKECPKCQAKIKSLGLKAAAKHSSEEKLQSYVIASVEKYLNSKGREIIGWDEILEGGLTPNATVMSWRSMQGGIDAARQGQKAIMAPSSHVYFDYYQTTDIENEPLAIGNYIPIEKVYSLEPVDPSLTADEAKYIIGVQANMWTEYIPTSQQVEYMLLPRLDALSEIQWTMPEKKDYKDFLSRLNRMVLHYDAKAYNYSKRVYDVSTNITANTKDEFIELSMLTADDAPIHYTLDGSEPSESSALYTEPLKISKAVTVKATTFRPNFNVPVITETFKINKATFKAITMNNEPKGTYRANGPITLIDGISGSNGTYRDGSWIGINEGDNVEAIIDLKEKTELSSAKIGTYVSVGDWIFGTTKFSVSVSEDGVTYKEVSTNSYPETPQGYKDGRLDVEAKFESVQAQYVKLSIGKTHLIPDWHQGKGNSAYLFLDEIELN